MTIGFSEQHELSKQKFKFFVSEHIVPFANDWDNNETFPREAVAKIAKEGILGAIIPKQFGGQEMDPITFGILCEEFGKGSISLISLLTVHGMVSQSILKWGTDQQKEKFLPKLASGEILSAFALSEPNVGSDPKSVETVATQDSNGDFILNGRKKWISCGQIADLYLVVAQVDTKPTAFLLDRKTLGLDVKPITGLYGFRSAMLAELIFDNCKVKSSDMLGRVGFGFSHVANAALDHGRYCVGWGCVGLGQACLDASLSYTSKRKQFGAYLRKHQLIQKMIADMATNVRAARALCLQAGNLKQMGEPDLIMETSIAKYFASKMALNAANDAVQIHGANGCGSEYPVQRYLRDAKITEIIEGSSQIQQIIISQSAYHRFLFESRNARKEKG